MPRMNFRRGLLLVNLRKLSYQLITDKVQLLIVATLFLQLIFSPLFKGLDTVIVLKTFAADSTN